MNGKSFPWLKKPLAPDPVSGFGARNSNVTIPSLEVLPPITTIPLELLIGKTLISWLKPVSLANMLTLDTADPNNFDWVTTSGCPTTITFGGVV